ncbi:large conductance mechanosensitive channel protein MscL [Suipraeoptans intestinalis]|uniref:Large-conductance mechanosensitive channel n=1 Tax=Suipraeoptans intestinalis TaxID=2606628 RepID=A0A6N7UQU8_9FIRM|nr:large conductance mechanosensitive channel protein MscL [Suipraeoptans intestinalis]MDD7770777.1 large conductance mechanosensitive channel protein MscL [Suipraeoptans intestinalis]MDY3122200.1 large conductance mechanosensitive channel protein MscL [Suipraeoptans intestinalis]MSR92961.1 large conductance mechanosensitive channel protein MscL [Suipraeoptans intestinalis]
MKKGFIGEFKEFITKGNVMDLAVGVIIGGAFTAIVTSLNADIIAPILGIFGGVDFSNLKLVLGSGKNAPVLMYGNFITAIINFLITALIIFCMVKGLNKLQNGMKKDEPAEEAAPATKKCPYCASEIAVEAVKCPHCTSSLS